MAKKKNWIAGAIRKPGALRKALHAKKGKPLTEAQLTKAVHMGGKMAKRANLAMTLKKMRKGM